MATGSAAVATRISKAPDTTNQFKTFLGRYFYLCMALVMAGLVVWGFSHTINASLIHANPPRPLLLWIHGSAFAAWIVLFIAQSSLVRVRKVSVHRTLGWFGAGLAAVMVVLGITIAVIMTRFDTAVLHQKGVAPFLSIPFEDMIVFGSGSIVSQLTQHGLIDEYQFVICPILLGSGRPLLSNVSKRLRLDLLEAKEYQSGDVLLRYACSKGR